MKITPIKYIGLVLVALFVAGSSYAQETKTEELPNDSLRNYILNEVTVKGSAKSVRIKGNSIIMNIANTELAKKGKLMDILPYMPFVSLQNKSIVVAGKGEPIFYLNGHRLYDSTELDKLLASDIKDIEVVTSPGAEYDATAKAVIKIRTKKQQGVGFSGNVETTICYLGNHKLSEMPRSNFNYRTGGLDFFASLNARNTRTKTEVEQKTSLATMDDMLVQNRNSISQDKWFGYDGNIGMDFTNEHWNLGVKYAFTKTPYLKNITEGNVRVLKNDEAFYDLSMKNMIDQDAFVQNLSVYAIYELTQHTKISTDWYFSKSDNDTEQQIEENNPASAIKKSGANSIYSNKMQAGKVEMQHSFHQGEIKYGVEYSHTRYVTDYENQNNSSLTPSASSQRKESTVAAYTSFTYKSNVISPSAGVRYEYCKVDYGSNEYDDSWSESNWFPFVSLQKALGRVNLSLSYTNKIRRPVYYSLRNNIIYNSPFEYSTGNAVLKSTISHSISALLSYRNFSGSVSYEIQKNPIFSMIRQYGNNEAVITRPENVNTYKHLVATGSWFGTIGFWKPYASVSLEKPFLKIDQQKYNKLQANFQLYNTFSTHNGYNFDVNATLYSGGNQNIKDREANGMLQLGVYKNFLGDNLYIGIYYNDVFKTEKDKYTIGLGNVWQHKSSYDFNNGVYLTAIYKFNSANSRYRGNRVGLSERTRLAI